ncbi:hypothetical protein OY671_007481 [Metschnikowia pulcherrima]|nr:hypothetical protein OY671_007481 [Metschnikowia pulcherrima]
MKEDSPASVMDPATMESFGFEKFGGKMTGQTFTAHPKVDPASGNMVAIGYAASGSCTDDVTYMEVSPAGESVREIWFKVPYYCMMHDFGITEDYSVSHIVPSIGSWERSEQGKPHFGFDTTSPVYSGIIPRRDGVTDADIRWFKRDNCFASHVSNAWQEGTKIHFIVPEAKNNMFPFFPDVHGAPFNGMEAMSRSTDWVVDMASNSEDFAEIRPSTDTASEFPRIDDRFTGRKTRYGWGSEMDMKRPVESRGGSAGGLSMNCSFLKDFETGAEQHWWCGPVSSSQEPAFVPRAKNAPEGDGWIVQVCNRSEEQRSDSSIFDALDIEKGPVATIHVPIRSRFGSHGRVNPPVSPPGLEFVYEATGDLKPPRPIGETYDGTRRIIPIVGGGRVEGPSISGKSVGNAADWQSTRPDGVTVADAIYASETDDGVVIQIRNRGSRHGPPEVMQRLAAGDTVDPAEYYFRTVPEFIAPKGRYEWMNRSIFICSGARFPSGIKSWVWRVS